MYRKRRTRWELLIAHPGGPLFRGRQEGAWTIPKGHIEAGEDPLEAAVREFEEETGFAPDGESYVPLGTVRLKSGKTVYGFAFEGDCEPSELNSMAFEMEWPRRSGRMRRFPEVDRLHFATPTEARRLLHPAQASFVDRLLDTLYPLRSFIAAKPNRALGRTPGVKGQESRNRRSKGRRPASRKKRSPQGGSDELNAT